MFENRINSKTNYILITAIATTSFIVARKTMPDIPAEIKIERIIDHEATRLAIERERLKLRSQFKQIKTREVIKLKNGEVKIKEKVQMQNLVLSESVAQSYEVIKENMRDTQKIELKTNLKRFRFDVSTRLKNEVTEFSPALLFAFTINHRLKNDVWTFAKIEHSLQNNKNYLSLGLNYSLEF